MPDINDNYYLLTLMTMKKNIIALILMALAVSINVCAEDGHSLWLRMTKNAQSANVTLQSKVKPTATVKIAMQELMDYWQGGKVDLIQNNGTSKSDGYTIATAADGTVTISASTDKGLLYGAYALLRSQETKTKADGTSTPEFAIRILNHWDNPNGTVERGYAGRSIFWGEEGVFSLNKELIREYARANASIGINATVLNNVNAKPLMLSKEKLKETKTIADILRPYGIRVYLAVNFASPKAIGGLDTADPLDAKVQRWWKKKADEIYKMIPDFGGFLVKANSEGEPGPMDFGRSHSDGANMLADALAPHNGVVMWRAFVYSPSSPDRANQAYDEFMPLDGQFRSNVIIQVKNGPIDFQPREAVSPLFFGMKKTPVMPEFQITQEYLGESIHAAFLAPMWKEFFGIVGEQRYPAISGVANIGDTRTWCGSDMAQANWYAFGRLAWSSKLTSEEIAHEWLAQTFCPEVVSNTELPRLMLASREATVHYMMPLGLHHIFAGGHHYGPEPWCDPAGWREDWKPRYYHKADKHGIGFDRTIATGSANTRQYPDALCRKYDNIDTCPEELLLWFHHVPWTHTMKNGETLWEAMCHTYDKGVREAETFCTIWFSAGKYIDTQRFEAQYKLFDRQAKDAWWWRDACLLYFQQFSGMQFPLDCPQPRHDLDDLMKYRLDMDNYTTADIKKLP